VASESAAHRAGTDSQRDPVQAARSSGPRLLEAAPVRADAQFPELPAHPESGRFQHRPLRGEDLLSPRRRKQLENHERVGHRLHAEPHGRQRAPLPRPGQRSRQGTEIVLRILHRQQFRPA
jgi:hypothetical protein